MCLALTNRVYPASFSITTRVCPTQVKRTNNVVVRIRAESRVGVEIPAHEHRVFGAATARGGARHEAGKLVNLRLPNPRAVRLCVRRKDVEASWLRGGRYLDVRVDDALQQAVCTRLEFLVAN